ncbi:MULTISPECIES: hypothetical protein [Alteromonadaceae]|uniref:hypothetical protein n=1 Tax=Alteromonadaceae TaxID=72275 RepID=UPI001C0849D1|nr:MULTISPECIES: hypothetical protein [Aliiglaciecola]MBU2878607.1 hypothetical protein [Aliiglaciecola lipolytica]MDO6709564.1 hypothetical protein [Aliiglaciecola sp. 2_MG-2023]MDO6750894.1 hypothetical protein [Aliiglaciecola sp. 1_MG-2023]
MDRKFIIFANAILFFMIATNLWSATYSWIVNDIDMSTNPNLQTALLYIICGFLFNEYTTEKSSKTDSNEG